MKISEFIDALKQTQAEHGDLEVMARVDPCDEYMPAEITPHRSQCSDDEDDNFIAIT